MIAPEILVVEDEEHLLDFMCSFLKMKGFRVIGALNSDAALEILKHNVPPLIVSDISMPGKNGLEFLNDVRAQGMSCAVVMLTAHDDMAKITEAMRLGALDYMLKPLDPESFLESVPIWIEIGMRLQKLSQEKDPDLLQKQLKMINLFRLKYNRIRKVISEG
jgi:DNA-binding NtrC family response regulator